MINLCFTSTFLLLKLGFEIYLPSLLTKIIQELAYCTVIIIINIIIIIRLTGQNRDGESPRRLKWDEHMHYNMHIQYTHIHLYDIILSLNEAKKTLFNFFNQFTH